MNEIVGFLVLSSFAIICALFLYVEGLVKELLNKKEAPAVIAPLAPLRAHNICCPRCSTSFFKSVLKNRRQHSVFRVLCPCGTVSQWEIINFKHAQLMGFSSPSARRANDLRKFV